MPTPNPPKRLSAGRWACAYRWTDSTGRRRCRTVYGTTRTEALNTARAAQMAQVMRSQVGADLDDDRPALMPTFKALAKRADTEWWPSRTKPRSQEMQRKRIDRWWMPAVGPMRINQITGGDVAGIISKARASGLSPATCNRILSAGSVVLQFGVKLKLIAANPARQDGELRFKEPKRRKKVLTAAQLKALVEACEPKWQPLIGLMAYAGLRHGEAVALTGDDVDLARRELTVRRGGADSDTTKGNRDRTIPLAPELHAILSAVKLRPGRRVSRLKDCRAALTRAGERTGIELHIHPHLLRHSFGTALGQAGVGAVVIQRILGHADLSTTQGYMHADVEAGSVDIFGASRG